MSSTKFPVKLKISYKVVSFKSPINEYHEGFLNEKHDKESISTHHHHHYHSNEIEMYWSEHEDDKSTSDSESDGDEERTIVVHRSALNSGGDSISSKISTSNVPKNGSTKKEIATPISTQGSTYREVPHSQVSTVVVDVPNELSPEIIKSNPHEDNDHPDHKTQVPDVNSSTFPDDTSKSTDRPILHIQLSNVSLEDEPIVIQKQRPPSLPPPSSMKPVQQKKPKPPVAPPPGDKSKSLKKESRSEKSSSPSLPSETKKKHSSSNSVGKKTQNSKKMVSLTINLDEPEEGEI